MAKDLPYFKFYCSEWSDGDISLEDMNLQGLFINICSYYWSNECQLTLTKCKKKFRNIEENNFNILIENNILKVDEKDCISISFLNEQFNEREEKSVKNSQNGKLGGRPKKANENPIESEIKPNALILESETKPKQKAIREEERREEEKREEDIEIHSLRLYISKNYHNVSKMKTQLTNENCIELIKKFGNTLIDTKLKAMENTAQLTKKNLSVYLTLTNWCSKDTTTKLTTLSNISPPSQYKRHE